MFRFLIFMILVIFCMPIFGQDEAELIFEEATSRLLTNNMEMTVQQKITDKKGRVKEKSFEVLMATFGEAEKTKMTMQKPDRAAGITIVVTKTPGNEGIIEVFTPANGKLRKMIATPKNMATVGSDFALSNYSSQKMEDLDIKLLEEPEIDGKMCYMLEVQKKANSSEGRAEIIVEQDSYRIIQIVTYNEKGAKSSISELSDYQPVKGMKGKFQPMSIFTQNIENQEQIEMLVLQIAPKYDFKEEDFKIDAGIE